MIAYLKGEITYKSPAYFIIECNGVGYGVHISLHTYSRIHKEERCKLYTYFHVKEDAQTLYGFADEAEKALFAHLISVSGIGPNTARMVLSSFPPEEIKWAIIRDDVKLIQSIKGIGPKTAQRLILELKDKLKKEPGEEATIKVPSSNTLKEEALSALIMLGFSKGDAEKAVHKVLTKNPQIDKVEDLIKEALKNM